ncbi:uncharacterized protein VTP21DRAFT_6535 [Calcarisporiella thermophila]|uniref:uncharacterized protein n=1 Tax=Calcarisporiella thermophila TaxID=911321 RepID=UPI0037434A85
MLFSINERYANTCISGYLENLQNVSIHTFAKAKYHRLSLRILFISAKSKNSKLSAGSYKKASRDGEAANGGPSSSSLTPHFLLTLSKTLKVQATFFLLY